jgi:DNA-binding NarL/FixJ family response regulator
MNIEPTIKVAFIDDHDLLRKGICEFLRGYGFEVLFEAEKTVSLQSTKSLFFKYIPDLCIVDVSMPVMNGFETTKALLEIYLN